MSQVLLHCMLVLDLWNTLPCLPEYSLCVSAVHVGWPTALKEDDPLQNTCAVRDYIKHRLQNSGMQASRPFYHCQLSTCCFRGSLDFIPCTTRLRTAPCSAYREILQLIISVSFESCPCMHAACCCATQHLRLCCRSRQASHLRVFKPMSKSCAGAVAPAPNRLSHTPMTC